MHATLFQNVSNAVKLKRKIWLRGLDSNQDNQLQRLACYQLHYPGMGKKSVADLGSICYSTRRNILRDEFKKMPACDSLQFPSGGKFQQKSF
jgi:hypothetical protein